MKRRACAMLAAAAATAMGMSAYGQLKISQVYGGGGSTGAPIGRDFVELHNVGLSPINLSGLTIQYAAATGTSWSQRALSGTVPPGGFFLVSLSATLSPSGSADITPDQQTTTLAISNTVGKVALMRQTAAITTGTSCPIGNPNLIDFVGYGLTANCFEGAGATPAPSTTTSVSRVGDGCTDIDSNNLDFTAGAPSPRNSASPLVSCAPHAAGSDLTVEAFTAPSDCSEPGTALSYSVTVRNYGPDATNAIVTITLPASNIQNETSVPAGTLLGNTLTIDLGTLAVGASAGATFSYEATANGLFDVSLAATPSAGVDPWTFDTTASSSIAVYDAPATAALRGILSEIAGSGNNSITVPGAGSTTFSGDFGRCYRSPNGRFWVMDAPTALTSTENEVLLIGDGLTYTAVAREGFTATAQGDLIGFFDSNTAVDNTGRYVFSTNTNNPTTTIDEVVLKWDGSSLITVAREGDSIPAQPGVTYGTTSGSVGIQNGQASFATTTSAGTGLDSSVLTADGATLAAQEGVTVPANQGGGTTETYDLFATPTEKIGQFFGGGSSSFRAEIKTVPTTSDLVLVENGTIVAQEGFPLAEYPGDNVSAIGYNYAELDGTRFALGSNSSGRDWVLRNGAVITKELDPIVPSSSERWDGTAGGFASTFFMVAGDNAGNYVVGGLTDAPAAANAVVVHNGTTVIVREGDPIDLNNDGVFNDNAYVGVFRDEKSFINDNNELVLVVRVRNCRQQLAGTGDIGNALIRIALPSLGGACCAGATCSIDTAASCTGPNTAYAGDSTVCNVYPAATSPCCFADYNHAGGITVQDIFDFLAGYFGADPIADINGGGLSVQDIFDFLAAYFGGGC